MKIHLATDHAGFEMKEALKAELLSGGMDVKDWGAYEHNPEDDYPDFIAPAAKAVSVDPENSRAVIFGGSGQGEAMLANRFPNVRAAVFYGHEGEIATLSREHNNANILSVGARFVSSEETVRITLAWLDADFSGEERHVRRIEKIENITRGLYSDKEL